MGVFWHVWVYKPSEILATELWDSTMRHHMVSLNYGGTTLLAFFLQLWFIVHGPYDPL